MKKLVTLFIALFVSSFAFGQGLISGTVTDDSNYPLIGAAVKIDNTDQGTITDIDGNFKLKTAKSGMVKLLISYIGFETKVIEVNVSGTTDLGTIVMESDEVMLSSIEVVADYAVERKTPVAFAQINKKEMEKVLGSRDIPLMMNITPSVYSTEQGGGSGDARINVRGFDQRNVAIMINGVPVNDMENGWVYWSNWDGVGDATSSVQLQRGLSSVNLATPSIGGTMNIVTSPADKKAGGVAKVEYGSGNFLKATVTGHTGMIADRFALSASLVRKVGDGLVKGTWTDAWAYYLGSSLKLNDKHSLELFAIGAPQRHGQNLYKQNIAAYSHDFAKDIDGYDTKAFDKFPEAKDGRFYNQNVSPVSKSYKGKQFWNGKEHDRYSEDYINERENFYHKPLVNLNWYADWSDRLEQYTVLYYSGGIGGGSGSLGGVKWNYHVGEESPSRYIAYDATIENNKGGESKGILRNSVNEQWTLGALSKFKYKWTRNISSTFGLDWRKAQIDHYREVRDLLGGEYFVDNKNEFKPNREAVLGTKIDYFNTNDVDWFGAFLQSEYSSELFSVYGMLGYSQIKYSYLDHFTRDAQDTAKAKLIETDWTNGLQVKGGANYRVTDNVNVYGNLGYVSKVPIFDAVIDDRNGVAAKNPVNEKFYAVEGGVNFFTDDNKFKARLSGYYTKWNDRTKKFYVNQQDGSDDLVYVTGMDQLHAGVELDLSYQPADLVKFGLSASYADWKNTNDVSGEYRSYEDSVSVKTYNYYVEGLKVGDAPQVQLVGSVTFYPVKGLSAQILWSYYDKFYAAWDPFSRTNKDDKSQSWKIPSYSLLDLHLSYDLPINSKYGVTLFAHGFNLFDQLFITDARDNSKYNAFMGDDNVNSHKASAAEVFIGLPRRFNAGLKFKF